MRRAQSPRRSRNNVSIYIVFAVLVPVLLGLGLIYLTAMGSIEPLWALVTVAGIASVVIALLS